MNLTPPHNVIAVGIIFHNDFQPFACTVVLPDTIRYYNVIAIVTGPPH